MKKKYNSGWYGESKDMDKMSVMNEDMCLEEEMVENQPCLSNMMLAHAYVPWQVYDKAFSPPEALTKGTLFPSLWGVYPIPE